MSFRLKQANYGLYRDQTFLRNLNENAVECADFKRVVSGD